MKIIIAHGTGGSPSINWFPWLSQELHTLGQTVITPKFPTPEGQSLESWLKTFEASFGFSNINDDCIVIGHSIGAAFVLRLLEQTKTPVKASFLVASFIQELGLPEYDILNKSFIAGSFDWETIKEHSHNFFVYHADNDPYVPLNCGQTVASALNIPLTLIPNGGHLNAESGYTQFPEILSSIKTLLNS